MDSGNSGGMQSSNDGDEEYDSRSDSIPTFLSNPNYNPISTPPSLFNHPSNYYLDAFSQSQTNQNPHDLLNLDLVWSRGLQFDQPNYTTLVGNLTASSTTTASSTHSILLASAQLSYPTSSTTTTMLRPVHENGSGIVKNNPKKRTRASRRAPTTVLTTDTSNFREMVQEFTGIPAPPFVTGSSYSRRLDLFGGGSSFYPSRPPSQKINQITPLVSSSPSFLNSSIVDHTSTNAINTNLNSNHGKYQADHDQDMLLSMQNDPMLTFQSLLQPPTNFSPQLKYPITGEAHFSGMKSQGPSQLEESRMSHENVNAHRSWRDGAGSSDNRSHEKGLEMTNSVSSRGEGRVDSWIFPSG